MTGHLGGHPILQALYNRTKHQASPPHVSAFLVSQQEILLKAGIPSIGPCKLQVIPCPQTCLYSHKLNRTLKHNLLLHREDQVMSDQLSGDTLHSLGLPQCDKTLCPSHTCHGCYSQTEGKFPAVNLLQHPHPIHQTLKLQAPLCLQNLQHPQPQRNAETQIATTQRGPRDRTRRAEKEFRL